MGGPSLPITPLGPAASGSSAAVSVAAAGAGAGAGAGSAAAAAASTDDEINPEVAVLLRTVRMRQPETPLADGKQWYQRFPFILRDTWQLSHKPRSGRFVHDMEGRLEVRDQPRGEFASMQATLDALATLCANHPVSSSFTTMFLGTKTLLDRHLPWRDIRRYRCLLADITAAAGGAYPDRPVHEYIMDLG